MGPKAKSKKTLSRPVTFPALLKFISNFLILLALSLLVLTFWPVVREEAKYDLKQIAKPIIRQEDLIPPNLEFSVVIPKIAAVAPVFANIDSQDPAKFLPVLRKGVAHAQGSVLPGQTGNVYLFAHSTDAFYNVGRYNAVFYLLGKLSKGDEIFLYFKGEKIRYTVTEVKVVDAKDVKYLGKYDSSNNTLTLQTCYPPGTTLKRLVILAKQITH